MVAISVCSYMVCLGLQVQEKLAVTISLGLLIVAVVATTVWYCLPSSKMKAVSADSLKRKSRLIMQLSAVFLAFVSRITTPSLEAGIVDSRLQLAMRGQPTEHKIEKAVQIVNEAKTNNVRVSPNVISQVGQKIVSSAAEPRLQQTAVEAANQFASYQSSLQSLPLRVTTITTLNATPTEPKGPPISLAIGCAEGRTGGKAQLHGIFGFAGFDLGNCSDVVVWPAKPILLHLDNVDGKNATFVNSTLIYNGGKLRLENVRFINCTFQIPVVYAGNQNVLQLLRAALSGQAINLELTA